VSSPGTTRSLERKTGATRLERIGPSPRIAVEWTGDGPLALYLHGIGGNRTNWRTQLPAAAGIAFRAAAWDARGYGDSDDYDGALDFADFAADLDRILEHFGVRRAHLIGLSMGGRIALDYYRRQPERVATLTLASTSAGMPSSHEKREEFLRLRQKPLLDGKTPADIAESVAATLAGPNITSNQRAELIASLAALRRESYLKTLATVTRFDDFLSYADIRVPTLVIGGSEDRIATAATVQKQAAEIPDSRLVLLEGAGHLTNIERPAEFNRALLAFLADHRRATER
jgi:3-oxoadipate enol-lactonase